MMTRKYSYYPAFDGKKSQPGTVKLVELCGAKWKATNMGIYAARLMRNSHTEGKKIGDPGMEKWMSVHSTGAACDLGYSDRKVGEAMWDFFLGNAAALGIEEIHDYAFDSDNADKNVGYGRGFRCSRGEGAAGVKIFTDSDNAGSFGGKWLHIELSPEMAKDAAKFAAAWNALTTAGAAPAPAKSAGAMAYPGTALTGGSTGDAVKALQTKLGVPATGTFDDATAKAVKAFKIKNGLPQDSIAGPKVWAKLFS